MKKIKSNKVLILPITESEKMALQNKIFTTIDRLAIRRKRFYIAASVTTLMTFMAVFGFYFLSAPSTSITDFANASKELDVNSTDEVVLILGEGKNLQVDDDTATINYSNTGEKVKLGSTTEINQQTSSDDKVVYNTLLVPYGKRSTVTLSDGTIVWLNSGSKIIYPAAFNGKRRELYLEGEAIFDVAHNKNQPFVVISDSQEIEVLGTVFSVTDYADEGVINTVLKSGSVQISYQTSSSTADNHIEKMKITPGTKASYNKENKSILSEKVDVDRYFSWKEGVLIFKNNQLSYITKRIARYYNVDIELESEDLDKETYSGTLNLNEDIHIVLENIKASTNMNYKFSEEKIIINPSS